MSGLRINISKISEGIHHRSLEVQPAEIGMDERFADPVKVQATLEKSTNHIYLKAEITAAGVFTCDRCVEEFRREIRTSYRVLYKFGSEEGTTPGEQEIVYIHPDTSFVDVVEDVRQYSTLAVPQKLLCREDCKGICPTCGIDRNRTTCKCEAEEVDPRWQGLRKFLEN